MTISAKDAKDIITAEVHRLHERLSEGTEGLPEAARERVVAARKRALEARRQVKDVARQGGDSAVDLFERQPLVVGALAFAVGAAIGALLPKTRREDHLVGAHSDALMTEAERVLNEERARASAVMTAAASDVEAAADDLRDAAAVHADAAVQSAKSGIKNS